MTKTFNRPDDVPSDDEPEFEPDLDQWQGQRVQREILPADRRQLYLGIL